MKNSSLFFLLFLVGCIQREPQPPTDIYVQDWFAENYEELVTLKDIGETNIALKRINVDSTEPSSYGPLNQSDLIAAERAVGILRKLDLEFVDYSRTFPDFQDTRFVSVPFYSWGLSLGGYSITIQFVANPEDIDTTIQNGQNVQFNPLNIDNWYIKHSDTR